MAARLPDDLARALADGQAIPYLGPGVLALAGADCPLPASPEALVARLVARASVPHKIRGNLTAAAQFIENFKHRKTLTGAMAEAFAPAVAPASLHRWVAGLPNLPLVVHAWFDALPQQALAGREGWTIQAVSPAEHFGTWFKSYGFDGAPLAAPGKGTLLYQPFGSVRPAGNFLVSDSDFVEVLTEIDIQTPIPDPVQALRAGRGFLFLGCRFQTQLERIFARQIMKRSSRRHWAVLPEAPSRNELRFLEEQGIERLELPLEAFLEAASLETAAA
jgi:hypothetical protein